MKRYSFFITLSLFTIVIGCLSVFFVTQNLEPQQAQIKGSSQPKSSSTSGTGGGTGGIGRIKKTFELRPGQIAFNPPTQMKVGKVESVKVRITDDLKRDLKRELKPELGDNVKVEQIKVSDWLIVNLKGDNFKITSIHPKEQVLSDGELVPWNWEVTPKKSGEQKLFLTVYSKRPEGQRHLKTFDRTIKVKVSYGYWLEQNSVQIIEIMIALGGTGFFAFIVARWKFVKSFVKSKR